MFKKTAIFAAFSASILLAGQAHAGAYAGGSLNIINYDDIDLGSIRFSAMSGIIGYNFNDFVSLEGRIGTGITQGEYEYWGSTIEVDLDTMVGGYVRLTAPVNDAFRPYVVAGTTQGKITYSVWSYEESESENDISFGAGFELGTEVTFRLEYMRYLDTEYTTISGVNLGILARF